MSTTYDPGERAYFDPADLKVELDRVFEICHSCRLCFNLCPSFERLFAAIDRRDGDVAALGDSERSEVVEACYQCKLCYLRCPYIPPHEWQLDFPGLMLRAWAQRARRASLRDKLTTAALASTDLVGKAATRVAGLSNTLVSKPQGLARRAMEATVGISAQRLLPPYAKERFSVWWRRRKRPMSARSRNVTDEVALFPTCSVEYWEPDIGKSLTRVFERNGVEINALCTAGCCGAPWLHAGEIGHFVDRAKRLLPAIRAAAGSRKLVVPQPTCAYVFRRDYPKYLGEETAGFLARQVVDSCEYLARLAREGALDTNFGDGGPKRIIYHAACHLQAQGIGLRARDLLKLTGAEVQVVAKCSGIDGMWGYRAENYEMANKVAVPLIREVRQASADVVAGDCHLANTAIFEATGLRPLHPIQVLDLAYRGENRVG
jgi:glycerol-3-phosphate dehydrogenase subunit C